MIRKLANDNMENVVGGLIVYDDGTWYVLDDQYKLWKAGAYDYNELRKCTDAASRQQFFESADTSDFKTEDLKKAIAKDIEVNSEFNPNAGKEYVRYITRRAYVNSTSPSGQVETHWMRKYFVPSDMYKLPRYPIA